MKSTVQKVETRFKCRECGNLTDYEGTRKIMSHTWKTQLRCPKCKGAVSRVLLKHYYSGDANVKTEAGP